MAVTNLQTWADNLETIRLPEIESDIADLQTRMTTEEAALVTKTTEINNTLTLHSARIDEAQVDADAAMAQANTSISNNIQLWTDAEIAWQTDLQNLRDELTGNISVSSASLTSSYEQAIIDQLNAEALKVSADFQNSVNQVNSVHSQIDAIKANIDVNVDTLNNVVLPAMNADIDQLQLDSATLLTDLTTLSSDLQTLYYTASDTNITIAGAITTLKSDIEDPLGTSLGATLSTDYRTAANQDAATAASLSTLQAEIEDPLGTSLGATLANDYRTTVNTDTAIATANSTLKAEIEDANGTSLGATVNTQGTAITTLEGFAAANYGLSVVAGDAAGTVSLTAWDNPESSGSALRIKVDNLDLDGNLNADWITTGKLVADHIFTDGITIGNENGAVFIPELGVDVINASPNLAMHVSGTRSGLLNGLASQPYKDVVNLTPGERYIITSLGNTDWIHIATRESSSIPFAVGDEIVPKSPTTLTGTGTVVDGYKEIVPGGIEIIQPFFYKAALHFYIDQHRQGGSWAYRLRQTYKGKGSQGLLEQPREMIYDDGTLTAIEQAVHDGYVEFLLREPEKSYDPGNGQLVNFYIYEMTNNGMSADRMRSALAGSDELQLTYDILSKDYVGGKQLRNRAQQTISGTLPMNIYGGSISAIGIEIGKEYIVQYIREEDEGGAGEGSLAAVGLPNGDARKGIKFTATADGSALSVPDQTYNRVSLIYNANEIIKGNFYMIIRSDTANTVLTSHGAKTGNRAEIFRATSSNPTTTEATKLVWAKPELFTLEWAGETLGGSGIVNVGGALTVSGVAK